MDKLKMRTPDLTDKNIERIASLFPNVITETKDENGNIKKAVDFDLLKQSLSKNLVEADDERYRLDWPGKKASLLKANTPITKTLRPCREESVNFDSTENLYIEGDNFEVLKILQESYLGKVKMIYIDPPYNTGNDFIYKDDYTKSKEDYEDDLGVTDDEGGKLFRNTDSNGRFHSDWLSMMYERLVVARDLLKDDGVIFISIDDNEVHNLRKICDEIFGEENFIDIFSWAKTETPANLSKKSKKIIEYIICYQKVRNDIKFTGVKKEAQSSNGLLNQSNKLGILEFPANLVQTNIPNGILSKGMYGTDNYDVELLEDTEVINNKFIKPVILKAKFKWGQTNLNNEIENGTIIRIPTIRFSPSYEKLDYDAEVPPNLINFKVGVGTNENAGTDLTNLMGKKVFTFPKPVSLIKYLMKFDDEPAGIFLDFFSGSGALGQATMELNQSGGNRKFVCVQLPEKIEIQSGGTEEENKIKLNAIELLNELKRPHLITEIGKERIRRAGKKIVEELKTKNQQLEIGQEPVDASKLDIGFRVYKTDESNMKDVFYHPAKLDQKQLAFLESNIKEDRTPEDLLTQVILDLGLELSLPIETKKIGKNKVFIVQTNALVACFDNDIDFKIVDTITGLKPYKVVFKDASFKDDKDRINVEERFKRLSPETKVTVI